MTILPEEGVVPPERDVLSSAELQDWKSFKERHPPGTSVQGEVLSTAPYGCYVDLGVPFRATLLVPYLDLSKELPRVGERVAAKIRHYSDDLGSVPGEIALTQIAAELG